MYSLKEFKKEILSSPEDLKILIANANSKYNLDFFNSDEEIVNWFFIEYPETYLYQTMIKANNIDLELKNLFLLNGDYYVKVEGYNDCITNLDLYTLTIEYNEKHFLNEVDYRKAISLLEQGVLDITSFNKPEIEELDNKMFITTDSFHGNYFENNSECCQGQFSISKGNIDLYQISLSGNDDYSITTDFINKEEAESVWKILCELSIVNHADLKDHYFSN